MVRKEPVLDLIKELNEVDETEGLEAKEAADKVGKTVYETICALSNEPDLGGGTILLGVDKEMALFPLYSPTGVSNPDQMASDISSGCASLFNHAIRVSITPEKIGDAIVLRVDVPELPKNQKPLYFEAQGLPKGAFRRVGPTDVRCTDEDLSAFFEGKANEPYDVHVVKEATWEDIDPAAIAAYRKVRSEANPLAEELAWSDEDMLHALGAVRREGGKIKITATGVLVFGKTQAIRRLFPTHRVDYIRVPGNTWVQDPARSFEATDMRGSIMNLIGRVIAAITDDLPKAFRIEENKSGQRTETPVIPIRVIREAVVNSLMHRNYQFFQPIQVVRYGNRLVIKNPGYSLKSQERFDDPGSYIRNPTIAEILHETRFAETKGSGIRVMQQWMTLSGLASPTFESDRDADEFSATFLFHHFLDEGDWAWLANFTELALSEDQMKALIFVREVGAIDNSTYRSLTQTDTLGASKSLRKLRELELLADRGSGARTYYVPGPDMIHRVNMDAKGGQKGTTIHAKGVNMDGSGAETAITLQDLPEGLRFAVRASHLRKRLDPNYAKSLIERLCAWKPLSVAEIALLLGKKPTHVSQKYLSPMVSSGRLEYLYPEMIQHPGQKYVAAKVPSRDRRR